MTEKPRATQPGQAGDAAVLTGIIRDLMSEIRPAEPAPVVRLDSRITGDLGLDSLVLVELRSRVEDAFGVDLPDSVFNAERPAEWLDAVRAARAGAGQVAPAAAVPGLSVVGGPAAGVPADARTLGEALAWHATAHPARTHIRLLHNSGGEPVTEEISYGELATGASAVAAGLAGRGLRPGERVAIMLPTCAEYFTAFMGTLLAGGVAVPVYPPARPSELEEHLRRQAAILGNAGAATLITVPEARMAARLLRAQVPSLRTVATAAELQATGSACQQALPEVAADDTALLQYTSGSTGDPKGVILSHRHLLANIRAMVTAAGAEPSDVFVSWLPLYHDMGLIGSWLAGLYDGFGLAVMSPLEFLARPARWLRAIAEQRGSLSAAPNFGYELCLRQVSDAELTGVDLSSWRLAFDGSETVSPATIRRFSERFAPYGLRPEAMAPAYGLAEAGVGVTFPPPGRGPLVDVVERDVLARKGRADPAQAADGTAVAFVSCGRPLPGYRLRVVDTAGTVLGERQEGQVEFTGPSATSGYFGNEAATAALCHGVWRDTGDLGYLAAGELYLTGRVKDIIIRGGRKLHPGELEDAVARLAGVEPGGVAVFGAPDPALGTERLVVAAETRLRDHDARAGLRDRITSAAVDLLGTPPDEVVLVTPGSVPKTASGKIRRSATRERYQAGTLGQAARGVRRQLARLALSAARARLGRAASSAGAWAYAGYAWAVTVLVGSGAWLLILALPRLQARWAVLRAAGRLLRRAAGVPLIVTGQVPASAARFVAVANHASFIDGLVLSLCLPGPLCYAAAQKFATQPVAGPFLRRLGCEFVGSAKPEKAAVGTRRLTDVLRSGRSLAVWPEGALGRLPGIRPFHLGAFEAAASAGAPVIPIGIQGSREVVRPGSRFPRRHAIHVAIGDPINPPGTGWTATLILRDQARSAVGTLCGEPAAG